MTTSDIGEFELIERIKKVVDSCRSNDVIQGIGDDCAVIKTSADLTLLITSDLLIEDVHFSLRYFDFYDVGWRAMAANLSDIAAMGGCPKYATVCLCLTRGPSVESVESLYHGMMAVADRFEVAVVGGDTAQTEDKCSVGLTVIGQCHEGEAALRSGAWIGDAIYVTGDLGRAEAGHRVLIHDRAEQQKFGACIERHRRPLPRINEGRSLISIIFAKQVRLGPGSMKTGFRSISKLSPSPDSWATRT
jgi:thiamine-monophosphate kinase